MRSERILELLARQLGNAATPIELKELETLLLENPEYQQLVSIVKSIEFNQTRQPNQKESAFVAENWEKLQQKMKSLNLPPDTIQETTPVKKLFSFSLFKRVAIWGAVVVFGAVIWLLASKPSGDTMSDSTVRQEVVPYGKPALKILPDGSEVWLNSGSRIQYSTDKVKNTREVKLEGEAYFKVFHDAEHPFIVHAGNIVVRALGTEFNVSAYPGDEHVATTLINGKVQVTMEERPDQKIILVPNEKFTVTKAKIPGKEPLLIKEISYEVKPVDIPSSFKEAAEVAWMQDKLVFQNESFYNLAKRLERRYDVRIVFYDESLKKESLSGVFENENIQKALRVLQMTTSFQYRIKADSVFLSRSL